MTDQHVKGAVSTAKGSAKEGVGSLTGGHKLEAKGKVQKVQGKVQGGLGDVQGRGRLQPIVVSAVGAVIVVVAAGLLTGMLRMSRGPG
jgi:uncharacterized protein YjbJ (UPF0337 family)